MNVMPSTVERLLYFTILMIFLGISLAIGLVYIQLHNQATISKEIQRAVAELKSDKAARDKVILDHTDCIAFFLSQPNRAEIRISDIQNCKLAPN